MKRKEDDAQLSDADRASVESTNSSYARVPYRSNPWTSGQPAQLETIARFHGLAPTPPARAKVLEIGCADGGNLIPLAYAAPGALFVGLDLAPNHIEVAEAEAEALGCANTQFHAASFVDFEHPSAPFDYIIAHGIMSWITPTLQGLLLDTCKRLLAPSGVAFISFNTFPGWGMQAAIRDVLRRHNRDIDDIDAQIRRSVQLLDVLLDNVPTREDAYRTYLESVATIARDPAKRYYFAHEYLEDENHPLYIRDFIERAASAGLGYLGDADRIDQQLDTMPEEPTRQIAALGGDRADRLQLLDFVMNRKFRQGLLCHADAPLRAEPDLALAAGMYVRSTLRPESEPERLDDDAPLAFRDKVGRAIEVDQPVIKAAFMRFVEVDTQPIHFDALVEWALERIGRSGERDDPQIAADIAGLAVAFARVYFADLIDLRASPPCWALAAGAKPRASLIARRSAATGSQTASLRHHTVALDNEMVCLVLGLLDGTRDRAALLAQLAGKLDAETLERILFLAANNSLLLPEEGPGEPPA